MKKMVFFIKIKHPNATFRKLHFLKKRNYLDHHLFMDINPINDRLERSCTRNFNNVLYVDVRLVYVGLDLTLRNRLVDSVRTELSLGLNNKYQEISFA